MSDSLLTLLEILDQVVQEEELKEQASGGGAPTEQELWDAISPGLLDQVEEHLNYKLASTNREGVINGVTNKDFEVAFRILNELIREEKLDLVKDKVEYIAAWLVKLNYFHLENPDAGYAFQNQPKVIQSLQKSKKWFGDRANKVFPNDLLKIPIEKEFEKITRFKLKESGSRKKIFPLIVANLENGIGTIATSAMVGEKLKTDKEQPAALKDSIYILDKFDYEELSERLKNKNENTDKLLSKFLKLSEISNERIPMPFKQFHIKYLVKYLTEAFEYMFESPDPEYFNILNYLKKYEIEKLPETLSNFINIQYQKFLEKYKDMFQKSDSGETFTDPEAISKKTINNQALQTIVKDFFKDFNDNSMQGRIEHLTKKMDIFKSKDISSEMKKQNINSLDFINRVLMMEYFIKFSKHFGALSAGLLFEYFLAALFGGTATGERGDAVDFEVQSGGEIKLGSAKFLSTDSMKNNRINSQKISTFSQFLGETITYVVGIKKQSDISFSIDKTTPLDIAQVDIYTFKVRYEGEENLYVNDGEKPRTDLVTEDGNFSFVKLVSNDEMKYIGTLQIMSTSEEGIHGFRQLVLKSVNEDTKNLLQTIQELFDHIKDADTKARKYVSSGDKFDGFDAQTALRAADGSISELKIQSGDYEDTSRVRQHHNRPAR